MIVCVCRRISDREIARHARAGLGFDEIQFELGVATQCGQCEGCARQVVDQLITDLVRTGLVDAYEQLTSDINSFDSSWVLAVLSRVQDGTPLAEAIAYEITAVSADLFVDSMRRRLAGRGA